MKGKLLLGTAASVLVFLTGCQTNNISEARRFPRKSQVGEFGLLAVWLVFQHNPLEQQERFLPQLEEAVRRGDIAPMYLAMLKDRIDIREGRPQKYGTQSGADGLCPLLDASRVNECNYSVIFTTSTISCWNECNYSVSLHWSAFRPQNLTKS